MKSFSPIILFLLLLAFRSNGQSVPQGMKYQAVARDLKGNILADSYIQLKITLYSDDEQKVNAYTEFHNVTTNRIGLFTLTIGEGTDTNGLFSDVPWSTKDIWMEVAVKTDDASDYITISDSRMLSVPYAFHAATASELVGSSDHLRDGGTTNEPVTDWRLWGNKGTDPAINKLGNTDRVDLVIVTNNIERMRVQGTSGNVIVKQDLSVEQNVNLNTVGGETNNKGKLTVEGATYLHNILEVTGTELVLDQTQSTMPNNGALVVKGGVGIGGNVNIAGDLSVAGATNFAGLVHFTNITQSTTKDDGAVVIEGGLGVEKNVNMGGTLGVKGSNTSFIAKMENQDNTTGDGIEIKLGRNHPAWNGSSYLNLTNPGTELFTDAINKVKGWINGNGFHPSDLISMIPGAFLAGTACNLVNYLNDQLTSSIGLPLSVPQTNIPGTPIVLVPGSTYCFGFSIADHDYNLGCVPEVKVPGLHIPEIPLLPAIPDLPCGSLPTFSTPVLSFNNVPNSLTNNNQFLSFKDKDDRELGSVRAESVTDWRTRYFDGTYFVGLMASIAGIDFVSGVAGAIAGYTEIAANYNQIGVEYASGHGDYAEWLERINPAENISDGDIVGVIGGKITKDLSHAEQVMAVSHKPIVLGNAPDPGKEPYGNKIAFMGQIPVKVKGPAAAGDFIVGNSSTPGYGIAIHPGDITSEQTRLCVGRSWESNANTGPKMINTVIGVDNGNFIKIIQDGEKRISEMDQRMKMLEAMVYEMNSKSQLQTDAVKKDRKKNDCGVAEVNNNKGHNEMNGSKK